MRLTAAVCFAVGALGLVGGILFERAADKDTDRKLEHLKWERARLEDLRDRTREPETEPAPGSGDNGTGTGE